MKKKSIFLLVASGLGLALVGSTFAAWAVTDNANPLHIKVSTGNITTDTTTTRVTLYYGQSQNIGNVGNLAADTYRKAGVLDLRADTSNSAAVNGKLAMTVTDSVGEGLTAMLNVDVYKTELTADASGVIAASTITNNASNKLTFTSGVSQTINTTHNVEHLFTVVVSLKSGITAAQLEALQGKVADIQLDWNIAETDIAEATTVYATGFGGDTYVYAFKGTTANAAWPGVKMTAANRAGYYTAEILNTFDYVVFNNGKTGDQEVKSADIAMTSFHDNINLYTHGAQTPLGTYVELVTPVYVLVGNQWGMKTVEGQSTGWHADGTGAVTMTAGTGANEGKWTGQLTTTGNGEFKVYDSANDIWYGEFGVNDANNVALGDAGTYNITFDPSAVTCITCAKVTA